MITHRQETQPPTEPAVRFYKLIAITFLLMTVGLLVVVIFITSKKAEVTILAKADTKRVTFTVKVGPGHTDATIILGGASTTMFSWTEKFFPTGTKTTEGTTTGMVTLYNKGPVAQTLIKTTRLLTSEGILFHMSDRATIPAGGEIPVAVYADKPGKDFDIGPSRFTIPGLSSDKQKIVWAESTKPMSGGLQKAGVLSAADLTGATNIYKTKVVEAYVKSAQAGGAVTKPLVVLTSTNATANHAVGDEVSEFAVSGRNELTVVTYNGTELQEALKRELAQKIDVTSEKVLSVIKEPEVLLDNFDSKTQTATLSVYQEVTVTLDPNGEKLASRIFFGKTKGEIERYILGLDHVSGVEVVFSPSWMPSAPSMPDKIKVVVRQVQ